MWQLLADPADSLGPALTQIGIGALIAVPAYAMTWKFWQRNSEDRDTIAALNEARIQDQKDAASRDRALSDRMAPLLADAAQILGTAPSRFEAALSQAQKATQASELERLVGKLQDMTRDLGK